MTPSAAGGGAWPAYATSSTGILAAGSVLAMLLFVVPQRFIVGAFVAGALKG